MTKTILILGAGFAGLPAAHYILKHQATKLDLKVVLVSPSEDYFWALATPRVVVPDLMDEGKIFYNIPILFQKYGQSRFEFIHGKADEWDPDQSSVLVTMSDGSTRLLDYHTIIVATGSHAKSQMPWKLIGDSKKTRAALASLRENVRDAHTIVIGGGGPTGVELAGELGNEYAKMGQKRITLITSSDMLLEPRIMESVRQTARLELEKMKVRVRTDTTVHKSTVDAHGLTVLELKKGDGTIETIKTDMFVPTWGVEFNSDFAPGGMRSSDGRLKVTKTQRAPGYNNAFIVGDVAEGHPQQVIYAERQVEYVMKNFETYFVGGELPEYVMSMSRVGQIISLGRNRAIGHLGKWRPWGWLLWYFKSRTLGTDYAPACAEGERFITIGSL